MTPVLTNLHAADVKYHVDCKATFMSPKSICSVSRRSVSTELNDSAFVQLSNIWLKIKLLYATPCIDIYTKYVEEGGHMLSRRQLISKVVEKFGEDMIVLSSPGIASILAFRSSATKVFHVLPDMMTLMT